MSKSAHILLYLLSVSFVANLNIFIQQKMWLCHVNTMLVTRVKILKEMSSNGSGKYSHKTSEKAHQTFGVEQK